MVPHRPSHWILLVLVVLAAIFTLREVHGQTSTNARSQFEGMPAMAGAQAGLGAQAGPAQGGIGLQGSDGAAIGMRLSRTTWWRPTTCRTRCCPTPRACRSAT